MSIKPPPPLEVRDGVGVYCARVDTTLGQAMAEATAAIQAAAADGLQFVIVDARNLVGLRPPSLAERAAMVRGWAAAAGRRLRVAAVVPAAFVDSERFGVVVAAGHGLTGDVFTEIDDAWTWINDQRGDAIGESEDLS
jgi:hypothetical protein